MEHWTVEVAGDNGVWHDTNGKKGSIKQKWSIVGKELHTEDDAGLWH